MTQILTFAKKIFAVSLSLWISLFSQLMTISLLQPVRAAGDINICHATGSHSHPWEAQHVDSSSWSTHQSHGDFLYEGPLHDGRPSHEGNDWCKNNVPNHAPVLSTHSNINEDTTNAAGKIVTYTKPTATDPDPGDTVNVVCTPASGSNFSTGTTTVTCVATDNHGATSSTTFTVTINYLAPVNHNPIFASASNITTHTTDSSGTTVTYTEPTATDPDGDTVNVTCTPASGTNFTIGTHTVTCTATDEKGGTDTTTFSVTVILDEVPNHAPVIGSHENISETTNDPDGKVVTYTNPSVTDEDGDSATVTCTPTSGSMFPTGTTTVTCTATDSHEATSISTFTVTITFEGITVQTIPSVPENLHFNNPALTCGSFTVVGSNTVDWDDATDVDGIAGYDYHVNYPTTSGGRADWYTYVTSSQYTGTLNQGVHHIQVRSVDTKGNKSEWTPYCDITLDTIAPSAPTGLRWLKTDQTTVVACGSAAAPQALIPDWNDSTDPNFAYYEYTSFWPDGHIGIDEQHMTTSRFVNSWIPPIEGTFGYAVRTVDLAGNKSPWSISAKTLAGSCQVIIDGTAPDVEITSPMPSVLSGSIAIRGSVTDDNPHHYWLVIQRVGGSVVAGPGTVNDTTSFTDKFFFNWNTTAVADGQYIVKLEARDAAGNKDTGSVDWHTVTVDNTPPILTLPSNITVEADNSAGTHVSYEASAMDTNDGTLPIACTPISGSLFPIGTTTVYCSAVDAKGNTSTGSFTVTVRDTTAPVVQQLEDITKEATSPAGATVEFTLPTATDAVTSELSVTCTPASGSTFALGTTPVTCSATDAAENTGSSTFNVIVVDTTKPTVSDVADMTLYEGDTTPGALVTGEDIVGVRKICFTLDSSNDSMDISTPECDSVEPGSPIVWNINEQFSLPATVDLSIIPEGTYDFTYWVEDTSGNTSDTQSTRVTVVNVPPLVTLSADKNGNGSYTFVAHPTSGNAPYTYQWSGACTGTGVTSTTGTTPATYMCTVTVTDVDGDTANSTLIKTITTPVVIRTVINNPQGGTVQGEKTQNTITPTPTPTGEVLGARTCTQTVKLVGIVFKDANKNGKQDSGENALSAITGKVTYTVDNVVYNVGTFNSDSNGRWEQLLCPGDYDVTVDKTSIARGLGDSSNVHKVSVLSTQAETTLLIPILVAASWSWLWWILLLVLVLLVAYYLYKRRKDELDKEVPLTK